MGILAYGFGIELLGIHWRPAIIAGAVAMFIMPAVANLHNSYTDLEEDARNLPGRIALVNAVGVKNLKRMVRYGLALVIILCALIGWLALVLAVAGVLLLLSYSAPPLRLKARPFSGLLIFSFVIAYPFLIAVTAGETWVQWNSPLEERRWIWLAYLVLLFMAKGCVKNVPDYEGDLHAGIRNSATRFGSIQKASLFAVFATWICYSLFPLTVFLTQAPSNLYFAIPWALVAMLHVVRLLRSDSPVYLNSVLKWDMAVSVVFLAHLVVLVELSASAWTVALCCIFIIIFADAIGADSRASNHLPRQAAEAANDDTRLGTHCNES
ncbi:UbiA prenyltransferase family protein [Corynebacterium amycolatum]|uniref:UbiA prenyltransferase family protein n=1 Tax=Corynebacterium amycolatum TaxID=43765 RepID=A0AB37GF18_CORAY|nr:UbiA family prenyltransferase [Corynebacterium amycolatum]QPR31415.1 UbiA prenyltransferase family protein [Corynebacterium amycolatum]QQB83295.1 UbiA prenyltransferase family protein [Corynebacterium amycolatum]QQV00862.1 UbiA prenyltransferase family protein [Corynebacterium amycolatum]